jgi:predicted RND superfamily exporter protein
MRNFQSPVLDVSKLPPELRSHYQSQDGTYALYIYPKNDLWQRADLQAFVEDVESSVKRVPDAPPANGIAIQVYYSTARIRGAFVHATLYALTLIVILVFLDLRRIGDTLMAISVLAFGLPMLIAIMGLLGIQWNFANFFGLPILIGAGHEYGVFLVHRYKETLAHPQHVWRGWDVADRALLLCFFVTSSSFGFFWALGHHEGLRSLGLVMAIGTACIYLAAVFVLEPVLKWRIALNQERAERRVEPQMNTDEHR